MEAFIYYNDIIVYEVKIMTQKLSPNSRCYNPSFVTINGKEIEIKEIILYKQNGELIKNGRGWFGSNNTTYEMGGIEIPDVTKRLKPKFDGETFYIPKKSEYSFDKNLQGTLYIPFEYFNFEMVMKDHSYGSGKTVSVPTYVSKSHKMDLKGTPVMVEDYSNSTSRISEEARKLTDEIRQLEFDLEKKKKELSQL